METEVQDTRWLRSPVKSTPNPGHNVIIYKAQSILTMNGEVGPVLEYEQALDVVRWAEQQGPVQ